MELHEYPRPNNDTGIGMHWVAGYATASGIAKIREFWIPELKELGVKWVKIYNHDSAIDFAELLLAEGFMPIVRIYQPTPNPSRLGLKELVHVEALIRAGVRYFEFNHEPDLDAAWRSGRVPADGFDLTAENAIANLDLILEKGGMPAIPALSNGSRWDLVGRIVQHGRRDLFDGPIWQAVHNYSRNRPLDYPYDIGNQEGVAYTARFYRAVVEEEWGENAWRGRSLAEVNRLRMSRRNPGATIADDHACWLAYEHFDALNQRHLGRSIPILSTECGYLVGEDGDPRYPATSPDLHMAQTLEACRIMMGTSKRFKPAPDYYFCTAFWLLANAKLGSSGSWWEGHAWYSNRWPTGVLPIVHALRAEPKRVRHWQGAGEVGARASLRGLVLNGHDEQRVVLSQDGRDLKRTRLDSRRRYHFEDLTPGTYTVRVEDTDVAHTIELTPSQTAAVVNLDLDTPDEGARRSVISGTVVGGAGAIVMLVRTGDGEEWVTLAQDDGTFRFVDLSAGVYSARVHPEGGRAEEIRMDGENEATIALHAFGWGHTVRYIDPGPSELANLIQCRVKGHNRIPVQAVGAQWESDVALTGSATELGPHACIIAPAEPGSVLVVVRDLPLPDGGTASAEARVRVDHKRIPFVEFVYTDAQATAAASHSQIAGHVIGELIPGMTLEIALIDEAGKRQTTAADESGQFLFAGLPAGLYTVELAGHPAAVSHADIGLDGASAVQVELVLPPVVDAEDRARGRSVLAGYAADAAGRSVHLADAVGNSFARTVDADGNFRFEHLPAGTYAVTVEGGYHQPGVELDGDGGREVLFSSLTVVWEADISVAGPMPGYSAVRVEVDGLRDHPVSIWQEDGDELTLRTGSEPDVGETVVEFKPLEPGRYLIRPHDVDAIATVDLTGLESVWVTFHRRLEPVTPHLVRPLPKSPPRANGTDAGGHYLYLGSDPLRTVDLQALLQFVAETGPTAGRSVEDARQASVVTIVGDVESSVLDELSAAGGVVRRFDEAQAVSGG